MSTALRLEQLVSMEQEGAYLTLPFDMPPGVEALSLSYQYTRYQEQASAEEGEGFGSRQEINIIDLGLIGPEGSQVGASGSNKTAIEISETDATPGYRARPLTPGRWLILIGAYKVAPEGVKVTYELTFTEKQLRLLKGDLHVHTLASDGATSVEELARRAQRQGLGFLGITDHNQMVSAESLPRLPGMTLIPGIEWTHFQGHANFLGVDRPYDEPYFANSFEEVWERFHSARERGALITINHPFDDACPFRFDMDALPFDCLEVWTGPMREANLRAIGFWNSLLVAGKTVPICGGSDYHRDGLFIFPGGPTTCVYAMSPSAADILDALRRGHAYVTFAPDGPELEMTAGDAIVGDSVAFDDVREVQIAAKGLQAGDLLQIITTEGVTPVLRTEVDGAYRGTYTMGKPGFVRVEMLRRFVPGLPLLPALISNAIFFE